MNEDVAKRRAAIDAIDEQIVRLLNERAAHAQAIGRLKADGPIYRPEREAEVRRRVLSGNPGPLSSDSVERIITEVISACRSLEGRLQVTYLGPSGTFSEMALRKQFGREVDAVPCASIDEVFRAAESGSTDYALVPVENSSEGAVGRTLDLLLTTPLRICAEVVLRVHQNAMRAGRTLEGVKRVYSHAQSLAQCQLWLAQNLPRAGQIPVASNAEAARLAAGEPESLALGPQIAAERYGIEIVARNVEDDPNNRTRFLVLGNQETARTGADCTSIVMSAPNRPGAVHALLAPLAKHGLSMSRLESRPARLGAWEYFFYVDLIGHCDDPPVAKALAELRGLAPFLKLLGSYPAAAA